MVEVDLLRSRVKVRMEESPETISYFANDDIAILRSGKAKKNDPPIPADLAPISGGGKRTRKEEPEEKLTLDPIRFRYREEAVIEESVEEPVQAAEDTKKNRRKNRGKNSKEEKPGETAVSTPKEEQPAAAEDKPAKKNHHRYYHRRKPKKAE